jgi:hypothetical protein
VKRQIRVLVTSRLRLTCVTRVETFADCPNIANVGETAYHADMGASRTEASPPDFLYSAGAQRDTHITTATAQINRGVKYWATFEPSPSY